MSKERAQRRAVREAAQAVERQRQARRDRRRQLLRRPVTALLSRRSAWPAWARFGRGGDSAIRRHRARQNGVLIAVLFSGNVLVWLLRPGWGWRLSALIASIALWPLFAVLAFDRRSTR